MFGAVMLDPENCKEICAEMPELEMDDGAHTIFLSTKGTNADEVPKELVRFLEYAGTPFQDSEKDFEDSFIRKLQNSVREVKASREMGARYMTFQELLKEERIEERRRIAKRMLEKGMDVEEIADCTRLTIEQVMEMHNEQ